MTAQTITAQTIRPGDVILTDPLDSRSGADVADVSRSSHNTDTDLMLVLPDGRIATLTLQNGQCVRRVS
jgi:hypothetical protein